VNEDEHKHEHHIYLFLLQMLQWWIHKI